MYLDGAEVPLTAAVHGSGIRSGAVLGLGRPIRRGDRVRVASPDAGPVLAEVHVVSGPASGRSFLLTAGSWEVGTAGHCAIRVDGPTPRPVGSG